MLICCDKIRLASKTHVLLDGNVWTLSDGLLTLFIGVLSHLEEKLMNYRVRFEASRFIGKRNLERFTLDCIFYLCKVIWKDTVTFMQDKKRIDPLDFSIG